MSINHQYLELQDKVYKRYQKAILSALSGTRVDPHDYTKRVPFLLITPEDVILYKVDKDNYSVLDGRKPIDYDREILETYSPEEDKIFKRVNEKLFLEGLLVEYTEDRVEAEIVNALSDADVLALASVKSPIVLKSRIKHITSFTTLDRIREKLTGLGRSKGFFDVLDERVKELG